ncbi:lysine N(6)-hydroxylase/L-ornithine N(5)-oxygenase family protein [Alkalibacillus haloalkaliphilus]|uniref:lysine N(6)-hydroxylase/L-ornithine N(5)-oxygenase family protein n=1 Tax=Alkalibacillus haloalkaliphilus TaxID=94136 RepID=UPI0029369EEE|nr:SidA/IucD/PvdA family monooxygenase [Alkalibacillus haloalkaliphilus]MDV2583285.1 SidA/IucD/PvdA family monooxygenase [Alkalibacillus haloalkaliphilus]
MEHKLYTFVGIGIGPYNLGLAALTEDLNDVDRVFFDQTPKMDWHPGMLIEGADLQVPFLADLITFADPKSRYTFLNYLHEHGRLYKFFFFQKLEIPRQEYNDYLQWATDQISGLYFGHRVVDVIEHQDTETPHYEVVVEDQETKEVSSYYAKHVVMATGSEPFVLESTEGLPEEDVLHTSRYLYHKDELLNSNHITVVGSGQSAAEVFYDLLEERENKEFHITWFTRSKGIFQLESAKMGQEYFSPNYVDYFHQLSFKKRQETLDTLDPLRNGVDESTLEGIYDMLYHYSIGEQDPKVTIQPLTEVNGIEQKGQRYELNCEQWQQEESFNYETEKVVLATGYKPNIPDWFMNRFENKIKWEQKEDYLFDISRRYRLKFKDERQNQFYMVTNLEHSHGTAATNLGLAIQRNMEIINDMLGEEVYQAQGHSIFQQFKHEG